MPPLPKNSRPYWDLLGTLKIPKIPMKKTHLWKPSLAIPYDLGFEPWIGRGPAILQKRSLLIGVGQGGLQVTPRIYHQFTSFNRNKPEGTLEHHSAQYFFGGICDFWIPKKTTKATNGPKSSLPTGHEPTEVWLVAGQGGHPSTSVVQDGPHKHQFQVVHNSTDFGVEKTPVIHLFIRPFIGVFSPYPQLVGAPPCMEK